MSSTWFHRKFPEAIDFQEGPGILAKDFCDAGVPLIRLKGLERGNDLLAGCNYLDEQLVSQRWSHFRLRRGDVLLSTSASLGRTAIVDEKAEGAIPYTGLIRMRPRDKSLESAFIPFLLQSPHFQNQVEAIGAGSVIRHFGPTHLKHMLVRFPDIQQQRAIARILGALDDKIELNRRTNETLEAMARALFQSWFVDFDPVRAKMEGRQPEGMDAETAKLFPSKLVDSDLGPIPFTWIAETLASAVSKGKTGELQTGPFGSQLHASDYVTDGVPCIMPKDIVRGRLSSDSVARIRESDAERLGAHRIRSGDLIFSRRGDVEKHALVREHEVGWVCGTGCLRIRLGAGGCNPLYASAWLATPNAREWLVRHAIGATMPNLNTTILGEVPFLTPSAAVQDAFARRVSPLDDLATSRLLESGTLTALRDTLLPKLLSGELRVPEAEKAVSAVL